ncbi:disabled homolog 2-like [Limulus polyphemus]|uniref:Disabled homolog 2-like n=1 Tax=Limulus polyphemus TaxID=6850 RepID=A0ABM1T3I1_LIMPO|nr:disabled homolog 2-like [Limulus polyphemus]XP_013782416.1 disabled homolog 2-like [Limulus polyphemus]XP_022250437.1 disabled homolog 2-like [Limulus polyphemus]XP_022250438.1 disabled homolog 2-like [Limulus polyphemus]
MKESIVKKNLEDSSVKEDDGNVTRCETKGEGNTKKIKELAEKKTKKEIKTWKDFKTGSKTKHVKKEKTDISKFQGEGIQFKAKMIGQDDVNEAQGDKMCQESLQRLKAIVRSSGEHKHRITLNISLEGIKIKDEKTNEELHHHPVHGISFISQDIGDARAFGYIFNTDDEYHRFTAIKTEKSASQVVITLRDLFQVILDSKQKEIEKIKQERDDKKEPDEKNNNIVEMNLGGTEESVLISSTAEEENIYAEIKNPSIPETVEVEQEEIIAKDSVAVDNLLGLQFELNSLQLGIQQMDNSIAAIAVAYDSVEDIPENDPFTLEFILTPKKVDFLASKTEDDLNISHLNSLSQKERRTSLASDVDVPPALQHTAPTNSAVSMAQAQQESKADKYAAFSQIDFIPSIFDDSDINKMNLSSKETSQQDGSFGKLVNQEDSNNVTGTFVIADPPPKPFKSTDLSFFAELDPLGKDRPLVEKKYFFYELKNPPKKVLKDLIGDSTDTSHETVSFNPDSLSEGQVSSIYESPTKQLISLSGTMPSYSSSSNVSSCSPVVSNPFKSCISDMSYPLRRISNPFICESQTPRPRLPARSSEPSFNIYSTPFSNVSHQNCVTPTLPLPRKNSLHSFKDISEDHCNSLSKDNSKQDSLSKSNSNHLVSPPIPIPNRRPPFLTCSTSPYTSFPENDSPYAEPRKNNQLLFQSSNSFDLGTQFTKEYSVGVSQTSAISRLGPSGHDSTVGNSLTKLKAQSLDSAYTLPDKNPFVRSQPKSFWHENNNHIDPTRKNRDELLLASSPSPQTLEGYQIDLSSSFVASGNTSAPWNMEKKFFFNEFGTSNEGTNMLFSSLSHSQYPSYTNGSQIDKTGKESSKNKSVSTPLSPKNNSFLRKFDPFADNFCQMDMNQLEEASEDQDSKVHNYE